MPARGLPFARGYREDYTSQQEAFDQRRRSEPRQDGWSVSHSETLGTGFFDQGTFTADVLRFARVPVRSEDVDVTVAAINVSTGAAGLLKTSVYVYSQEDRTLNVVAGSAVDFDVTTTARVTEDVNFSFLANERYFIGANIDTGTAQLTGTSLPTTEVNPILFIDSSGTNFAKIPASDLQQGFTARMPVIIYYSAESALLYE